MNSLRHVLFIAATALAVAAFALPARAEEELHATFIPKNAKNTSRGTFALQVSGLSKFPEGTLIYFAFRLPHETDTEWVYFPLDAEGRVKERVPIRKRLIRGTYEVEAVLSVERQPRDIYSKLRRQGYDQDHQEVLASGTVTVGTAAEAEQDDEVVRKTYVRHFEKVEKIVEKGLELYETRPVAENKEEMKAIVQKAQADYQRIGQKGFDLSNKIMKWKKRFFLIPRQRMAYLLGSVPSDVVELLELRHYDLARALNAEKNPELEERLAVEDDIVSNVRRSVKELREGLEIPEEAEETEEKPAEHGK